MPVLAASVFIVGMRYIQIITRTRKVFFFFLLFCPLNKDLVLMVPVLLTFTKISFDFAIQLVLLGDSGVGKSCIVLRFVRGQFDPTSKVRRT